MPAQKLKSKTGAGSKEIKVYDEPRSPFVRLSERAGLPPEYKNALRDRHSLYNPAELWQNVGSAVLRLRQRLTQVNRVKTQE
jgi:hypothetical protein